VDTGSTGGLTAPTVSFLSDYGTTDEFVGVVHSVLRRLAPEAAIVDLTHGISPFDVRAGALALRRAARWCAPGVILAVVDPGVGTARRGVAVCTAGGPALVGPDNGLLAPAIEVLGGAEQVVELVARQVPGANAAGSTFDGRDLFAPAAAHLCRGGMPDLLGPELDPGSLTASPLRRPSHTVGDDGAPALEAEVWWIDRFGNVELNATPADLGPLLEAADRAEPAVVGAAPVLRLDVGDESLAAYVVANFAEVPAGRVGIVPDSQGHLALVVDRGSAAGRLWLHEGDEVHLRSW
jgi:S-adenosylmethionine hydrolase